MSLKDDLSRIRGMLPEPSRRNNAEWEMFDRLTTEALLRQKRLYEAAPDLLEALKEANALLLAPAEDVKEAVLSRIRAALTKAGGGAS